MKADTVEMAIEQAVERVRSSSRPSDLKLATVGPDPAEDAQPVPIRLVLISDLLMIREALRDFLASRGIESVEEAATCEEALEVAARHQPDIFLIDMDCQAGTFTCLKELTELHHGRIVALCGHGVSDHAALIERGAAGIVLKNQTGDVLIKAITKVHAGEAWLDRTNTAKVLARIVRRRHIENIEAEKIARLTARERQIISLIGEGLKNAAIGQRLFISEATVRNHLTSILDKLGLSDRFELAVYAFRHHLVRYPDVLGSPRPKKN
jgi:DNA-binding NarL/FixJ family response regulator